MGFINTQFQTELVTARPIVSRSQKGAVPPSPNSIKETNQSSTRKGWSEVYFSPVPGVTMAQGRAGNLYLPSSKETEQIVPRVSQLCSPLHTHPQGQQDPEGSRVTNSASVRPKEVVRWRVSWYSTFPSPKGGSGLSRKLISQPKSVAKKKCKKVAHFTRKLSLS